MLLSSSKDGFEVIKVDEGAKSEDDEEGEVEGEEGKGKNENIDLRVLFGLGIDLLVIKSESSDP